MYLLVLFHGSQILKHSQMIYYDFVADLCVVSYS